MPLRTLECSKTLVADLAPLKGMPLHYLQIHDTKVSELAPVQGMPLDRMDIDGTSVTDVSPLKGMLLKDIRLTPKDITQGMEVLREMKSLQTIGIEYRKVWPAAEFWARYDKGEFKMGWAEAAISGLIGTTSIDPRSRNAKIRTWAEPKTTGMDPQERADEEAVLRHAFHGEPLDPEVARRSFHERAARVTEEIYRVHGEIDDATFEALLRDDDE